MLTLWTQLKPHLTDEQADMISSAGDDFYVAAENNDHWTLTKTRAMRREGIDSSWNAQPERPLVEPRQFLKANGEVIRGLENPYATQSPVVELHVMAGMAGGRPENISLMPARAADIINPKKAEQILMVEQGRLRVTHDNSKSAKAYEYYTKKDTVGYWPHKVDLSQSRGVAITVKGDGSGSTLVLSTDGFPRTYAVDIDFTGERTIEIPNGEACNNREGWKIGSAGTITQGGYGEVNHFRLYLHKVPAGKRANIEVTRIEAMKEDRNMGLVEPVLDLNGTKVGVIGTVPYDHYLAYSGGTTAKVYGPNWNFVKALPVKGAGLQAAHGKNTFSVTSARSPVTWLSARIKVQDTEHVARIAKR